MTFSIGSFILGALAFGVVTFISVFIAVKIEKKKKEKGGKNE